MSKNRYQNLQHLNLLLTNKCNKKCDYCYEQHDKDYGDFTSASLMESFNFLGEANDHEEKYFQFFGGEPLIRKDLILKFLKENQREIEMRPEVKISMVTNGTLLTDDFIQEYFSYENTQMMISLDSHKSDVEHRHTSQKGVQDILDKCKKIRQLGGDLTIRCTLSLETLPYLEEFIDILVDLDVNSMVVHPLTLSATEGFIEWPKEDWEKLRRTLKKAMDHDDFMIHFSEGTGTRSCESNCMVGDNMIAMDGSGDYSGCYFFTNQKEALPETILGNLFNGEVHEDRYESFEDSYAQHFERDEKCNTCDLQNYCYQCPAGNLSTGNKEMFRSDAMCQRIVELFLDLRRDENAKKLKRRIELVANAHKEEGDIVYSRAIYQLTYRLRSGHYIPFDSLKRMKLPNYKKMMAFIMANPEFSFHQDIGVVKAAIDSFEGSIETRHFVNLFGKDSGTTNDNANIGLLHFLMSPRKKDDGEIHTNSILRKLL